MVVVVSRVATVEGMKNHLVAERRPDKNGVVSTKWVRPVAGGHVVAANVPAPVKPVSAREDWDSLAGSAIDDVFRESYMGRYGTGALNLFDYEAVVAVNKLIEGDPYFRHETMRVCNQAYRRLTGEEDSREPFLPMNDVAVFGEIVFRVDSEANDMEPVVKGLARHFGEGRDYLHGVSEEERAAAVALVTVVTTIGDCDQLVIDDPDREGPGGPRRAFFLRSAELEELVVVNPERAEEIAEIIKERDSDDAGMIAAVLGLGNRALQEGML